MSLNINVVSDKGNKILKFEDRGTKYDVFVKGEEYTVWSKRLSISFDTQIKVYYGLKELAARSKTFANLAAFIADIDKPANVVH